MVDDPSEHTDVLLSDPDKKRAATRELRKRQAAWSVSQAAREAAQLINDQSVPEAGAEPTLAECAADNERERLFRIIEDLVLWENTTNETVLQQARDEIWQSWRYTCAENAGHPRARELFDRHKLPAFHDPFAGGGALPLEAQRLGLESYASDLNPVAVLINKAMIEIPPKFAGQPPINPEARRQKTLLEREWQGAQGLAEDVRYYGKWMRDEAEKRIGHLYPKIEITAEMAEERPDLKKYVGQKLTVIAWLWARTVKSPNPAFADVNVPLASTFMLSTKAGKEAYVEPVIEDSGYRFTVNAGKPKHVEASKNGTKLLGANFRCLMSDAPISGGYIKEEGQEGRIDARMMAIVAEGERERVYLAPTPEMEAVALKADPVWKPDVEFVQQALGFRIGNYGMTKWSDLFTNRQLAGLTTFSDLVQEAHEQVERDAVIAGRSDDSISLTDGGTHATAYADAVSVYLAFALDRMAMTGNNLVRWNSVGQKAQHCFGRQTLSMLWDFAEPNFLASATGSINAAVFYSYDPLNSLQSTVAGSSAQDDAATQHRTDSKVVSTDPPYFDNVGYADLSDFFYVWLRVSLITVFPELFATLTVPKADELVATPYRHGGKDQAEAFFLDGMTRAISRLSAQAHPAFPVTIYYAFKQTESDDGTGSASTGWETFLDAVIHAGFSITGTWPMRTELANRMRGMDSNALASSIVLVCRTRSANAPIVTRREFVTTLRSELPFALAHLQRSNIAPVDLAQAAIGPGMAVYSRYAKVLDAEGKSLSVRQALALINQTLDEVLAEQEGDFDADSRWALAWFSDHGFADGPFDDAHTYFLRFNTAENALKEAGIVKSGGGNVRLLKPSELASDWDPLTDPRLTAWEMVHYLIRELEAGGEGAAAGLIAKLGAKAEIARELGYRLYTLSERKKRAADALSYNSLVQSWPEITRLARERGAPVEGQSALFGAEV